MILFPLLLPATWGWMQAGKSQFGLCFQSLQPWGSQCTLEHPAGSRDAMWDVQEDEAGQRELAWSEGQCWGWVQSVGTWHKATMTHLCLVEEQRNRLCGTQSCLLLPRHSAESSQGNVLPEMSREVLHLFYGPFL